MVSNQIIEVLNEICNKFGLAIDWTSKNVQPYWDMIRGRFSCLNRYYNVDFPMVKWEDYEPWLIEDLKKLKVVEQYEQRDTFQSKKRI